MTNFEKIKSMTIDEATEFFTNTEENIACKACSKEHCKSWSDDGRCYDIGEAPCMAATKHWLESEVDGEGKL